jgi:succinate dehydrogenase / fumarate reductase flavoprotein subunit
MMQCLADGYFIVPHCVTDYLSRQADHVDPGDSAFGVAREEAEKRLASLLGVGGTTPATVFHRELGNVMLDRCGITRDSEGLRGAIGEIARVRDEFWADLRVDGTQGDLNQSLEYAGRVADFLEFSELMCRDALEREESCGCHLREEHQTEAGEAVRDDARFAHVAVWEHRGDDAEPVRHTEPLRFEMLEPVTRSYQ